MYLWRSALHWSLVLSQLLMAVPIHARCTANEGDIGRNSMQSETCAAGQQQIIDMQGHAGGQNWTPGWAWPSCHEDWLWIHAPAVLSHAARSDVD